MRNEWKIQPSVLFRGNVQDTAATFNDARRAMRRLEAQREVNILSPITGGWITTDDLRH